MKDLIRYLVGSRRGAGPVYLAVLCVGLVLVGVALAFVPSRSLNLLTRESTTEIGTSAEAKKANEEKKQLEDEKKQREAHWREISPHHWRVVGWVLECTNIKEVDKLPHYLREFFNPTNVSMDPLK